MAKKSKNLFGNFYFYVPHLANGYRTFPTQNLAISAEDLLIICLGDENCNAARHPHAAFVKLDFDCSKTA